MYGIIKVDYEMSHGEVVIAVKYMDHDLREVHTAVVPCIFVKEEKE